MGNYYEGNIRVGLSKNLPEEYKDLFLKLSKNEAIPLQFSNAKYFLKDRWNYPSFSFGYWCSNKNEEDYLTEVYEEQLPPDGIVKGYYIEINFCMKGYNRHMEDFFELILPFIHKDAPNYLGSIKDEDGSYNKDFFINDSDLKNEINKRKIVCMGCNYFFSESLCDKYDLCSEVFSRGVNSLPPKK